MEMPNSKITKFASAAVLLAGLMLAGAARAAEWAADGNNIYNLNSGNVGVGTNNPGNYKFNVSGDSFASTLAVGNPASGPNFYLQSYPVGGANRNVFGAGVAGYSNGFQVLYNNSPKEMKYTFMDGKVGIDTANPGIYKLNVNGNAFATTLAAGNPASGPNFYLQSYPMGGENRNVFGAGVAGFSNGFQIIYNHTQTAMKYSFVNGNVGIGTPAPGELLHIQTGNLLMDSASEQEIRMRNSSLPGKPMFKLGRMVIAGDGSPEFRVLYQDDGTSERSVFEFDKKGIVASVKPAVGSHFEGFIAGQKEPLFRLNSSPSMQLEFGPGGNSPTDAAIRRGGNNVLSFITGDTTDKAVERMRIDPSGNVGIGTASPTAKLEVFGGNFKINGNIVSDGDICMGVCE